MRREDHFRRLGSAMEHKGFADQRLFGKEEAAFEAPAAVHRNARSSPLAVSLRPTTCPASLMACATLFDPPNVPRSTMPPDGVHRNA